MTTMSNKALDIARTYVAAMAKKDVETIISISAEHVVCTSPIGQTTGIERFRGFQEGFARMITNLTVLAVYGDDEQAVVVYDAETHPVPHSVVAELLKVRDGKLASTEVIYDATLFAAYMASVQPH
ncbi:nuclear transport factor 2 family protein [Dickeya dadantii]|uniref:nuclear transport factor 2 family protein n=1 Tax=Dickeya dadantii TaxID=204038 RepID=UPI001C0A93C9|nr:nuclear transport factor 2 family protein [Dickeya dadantii]MCA7011240.1 nuclear transport factor 2 family protein [Dickeya dadantii]QWT39622.1 nuclear transport factor 2 family protein [Dickeya dadantii]